MISTISALYPASQRPLPQNWTVDDIWYVSYGAGAANPLPLIYATDGANAVQWYQMSLYSFTTYGYPMSIRGTMTQYRACLQRPLSCDDSVKNSPSDGYFQLYDALNADPHTAQPLFWSTDINYQGESP